MRCSFSFPEPRALLRALPLIALAAACTERTTARAQQALPCDLPQRIALLPPAIIEASGIVVSRTHEGVLWVHGDDDPHLYAIDRHGRQLARVRLRHEIDDWEDLAIADCAVGSCLYIADIGDNRHRRDQVAIYRIPEPALSDTVAAVPEIFRFRYPDGPRDAEAIFVLPGERLHVVTKGRNGPIALYWLPAWTADGTVVLEHVRAFTPGLVQFPDMVTGADASRAGRWVALRTYGYVDLYPVVGDTIATAATVRVPLAPLDEPQGEGVALGEGGEILLVSERGRRAEAPLSRLRCTLP